MQYDRQKQQKQLPPEVAALFGKAFKSGSTRDLDPAIRRGIVNMELQTSKKAGTASNQTAAAATALLTYLSLQGPGFGPVTMAWTGLQICAIA